MAGSLMNMARKDAKKINKSLGWESDIELSTPNGDLTLNLKGIHTKHNLTIDDLGQRVNGKNAHILIDESDLVSNDYPYRNKTGNIALESHLVNVADSEGVVKKFKINETFPSETLGLIVCVLGDIDKKNMSYGGFNRL